LTIFPRLAGTLSAPNGRLHVDMHVASKPSRHVSLLAMSHPLHDIRCRDDLMPGEAPSMHVHQTHSNPRPLAFTCPHSTCTCTHTHTWHIRTNTNPSEQPRTHTCMTQRHTLCKAHTNTGRHAHFMSQALLHCWRATQRWTMRSWLPSERPWRAHGPLNTQQRTLRPYVEPGRQCVFHALHCVRGPVLQAP